MEYVWKVSFQCRMSCTFIFLIRSRFQISRGFTPDEFQALDFSRIDLSEYFEDVQKDLATKIDDSQQTIMQNIQNKYEATPK